MNEKQRKRHVSRDATRLFRRYAYEGFSKGLTIAEWEALEGLPRFSVWPEAARARSFRDPGFFLYRNATEQERQAMRHRENVHHRSKRAA